MPGPRVRLKAGPWARHDVEAGPLGQALSYLVSDVTAAPNVMAGLVPTIYRSTKIAQMAGTGPAMTGERTASPYATAAVTDDSPYTPRALAIGASRLVIPSTVSAPPRYSSPSAGISAAIASSTRALVGGSK